MPYSTGCTTPLSNFESSQNYKDVNDPAGKKSTNIINHTIANSPV
jgi:isoleucyl-tRNA synthetase